MPTDFELDPADYLGIEHEAFKADMLQLALSKPSEYFQLRKDVLAAVKKKAVEDQYKVYYKLLTTGEKPGGGHIFGSGNAKATLFVPKMPKQKVNEFALKAAKTIDAIAEEAVEMLLPSDYRKIAEARTSQRTAGNMGFN
jgi:hypothetical protein